MSAFIVDDKTINEVVGHLWTDDCPFRAIRLAILSAIDVSEDDPKADPPAQLACAMFAMNVEAVNQRYGQNGNG